MFLDDKDNRTNLKWHNMIVYSKKNTTFIYKKKTRSTVIQRYGFSTQKSNLISFNTEDHH